MARLCTVCTHPERKAIDLAVTLRHQGIGAIARRYGLAKRSLQRHQYNHLSMSLELSKGLGAMLSANNLLDKLADLDERTLRLLDTAEQHGDIRAALAAIRESRGNIEAFADLTVHQDVRERLDALEERIREGGGQSEAGID